jgi:hypothetical protein
MRGNQGGATTTVRHASQTERTSMPDDPRTPEMRTTSFRAMPGVGGPDADDDTQSNRPYQGPLDSTPAREPILEGFDQAHQSALRDAYQHTKRMVDAALEKLRSIGPDDTFKRWFGIPNQGNLGEVERVLSNMDRALASDQYLVKGLPAADGWELAHMNYASPHEIDLRPHFWDNVFGHNQSEATIAHELSHFQNIGFTHDYMYGPGNVQQLARNNPFTAMHNAENYGMFIREQTAA